MLHRALTNSSSKGKEACSVDKIRKKYKKRTKATQRAKNIKYAQVIVSCHKLFLFHLINLFLYSDEDLLVEMSVKHILKFHSFPVPRRGHKASS